MKSMRSTWRTVVRHPPAPAASASDLGEAAESPERSDEELAKSAQQGDSQAFGQLFARYKQELGGLAWKLYPQASQDLLQEAYLVACARIRTFRAPYNFKAWMAEILRRTAMAWRKPRREVLFGPERDAEDIDKRWEGATAADRSDLKEMLQILDSELKTLDASGQEMGSYMLDFFSKNDNWPSKREAAGHFQIPPTTALRRIQTILIAWKRKCEKAGFSLT